MENLLSEQEAKDLFLKLNKLYRDSELSNILGINRPAISSMRSGKLKFSKRSILVLSLFAIGRDFDTIAREKEYNDIIDLCRKYTKYEGGLDDLLYDLPNNIKHPN